MSTRRIVWEVANAIIELTMILWAVIAHGFMEKNDVESTCGGTRLNNIIRKDEKFLTEMLARGKNF